MINADKSANGKIVETMRMRQTIVAVERQTLERMLEERWFRFTKKFRWSREEGFQALPESSWYRRISNYDDIIIRAWADLLRKLPHRSVFGRFRSGEDDNNETLPKELNKHCQVRLWLDVIEQLPSSYFLVSRGARPK